MTLLVDNNLETIDEFNLDKFRGLTLQKSLPVSLVNIDEKRRSNLFTWRGQFSPQLVEQLLVNYASEDDVVFDPFLGSGTVLYECALLGLKAFGTEINPAAIAFANVYELINYPRKRLLSEITKIDCIINPFFNHLTCNTNEPTRQFETTILNRYRNCESKIEKTILFALITGMDFEAKKTDEKRIENVWKTLKSTIENLPRSKKTVKCYLSDARRSPLKNQSVDMVITSPPYINVFNYHQNYRKSVEKTGVDVLHVAKSEIGANRKFRQNRFLTVVQYCMDMAEVFLELSRVCKPNAKIFFIVGRESNVRKTSFRNAELISKVAQVCCFNVVGNQSRVFTNKFGESIYEEILRIKPVIKNNNDPIEKAREIGRTALKESLNSCSKSVEEEIIDAIEKSLNISSSPILKY